MNKQWRDCFDAGFKFFDEGYGSFAGYASTYAVDAGNDQVVRGAYTATLPTFLKDGFIALGHDWGGLSIGYPTNAYEDDHGLWLEGAFHSTPEAQNARTVMRERLNAGKTIGLSIGYATPPSGTERRDDGVRLLKTIDLFEVSMVTVPMNAQATVAGVKGDTDTKGAIPPKKTATSDAGWDGPANEANLSNDAGAATYRQAYAWVDPDKDPDTKAAYKFIHHQVSADGSVGAANIKACITGIGVLNGGRGGTQANDREGIYAHLAKHIKDSGSTPPDLKVWDDFSRASFVPGHFNMFPSGTYTYTITSTGNTTTKATPSVTDQLLALIKSLDTDDPTALGAALSYAEHLELVAALADRLVAESKAIETRAADRQAYRAKEGRTFSQRNAAALAQHAAALHDIGTSIEGMVNDYTSSDNRPAGDVIPEPKPNPKKDGIAAWAEAQLTLMRLQGVTV